MFKLGKLSKVE